jgi:copper chaperone CopZ
VPIEFVVEQAGCASCAALVEDALGALGSVERVDVDEAADTASVRLSPHDEELSVGELDRALAEASGGTGHTYRVRAGSVSRQ